MGAFCHFSEHNSLQSFLPPFLEAQQNAKKFMRRDQTIFLLCISGEAKVLAPCHNLNYKTSWYQMISLKNYQSSLSLPRSGNMTALTLFQIKEQTRQLCENSWNSISNKKAIVHFGELICQCLTTLFTFRLHSSLLSLKTKQNCLKCTSRFLYCSWTWNYNLVTRKIFGLTVFPYDSIFPKGRFQPSVELPVKQIKDSSTISIATSAFAVLTWLCLFRICFCEKQGQIEHTAWLTANLTRVWSVHTGVFWR